MRPDELIEELTAKNLALSHAIQSGVAFTKGENGESAKHLRVGINVAMCMHAAIAALLIERGLFDLAQYLTACNVELEKEVRRYEDELSAVHGRSIHLR